MNQWRFRQKGKLLPNVLQICSAGGFYKEVGDNRYSERASGDKIFRMAKNRRLDSMNVRSGLGDQTSKQCPLIRWRQHCPVGEAIIIHNIIFCSPRQRRSPADVISWIASRNVICSRQVIVRQNLQVKSIVISSPFTNFSRRLIQWIANSKVGP